MLAMDPLHPSPRSESGIVLKSHERRQFPVLGVVSRLKLKSGNHGRRRPLDCPHQRFAVWVGKACFQVATKFCEGDAEPCVYVYWCRPIPCKGAISSCTCKFLCHQRIRIRIVLENDPNKIGRRFWRNLPAFFSTQKNIEGRLQPAAGNSNTVPEVPVCMRSQKNVTIKLQ